ncbi:MAG: hypothetical protein DIZ80_02475 [endosymbiont of Galathealinum brachiosum]|uniref:histidine kinase n=1 Tax=endosymbiont of Galathealinum brachiosum TaxID=2200906 RepID=A0A370DK67_9GAMM|nr:MAG: hypothetical protein DIZ80_02475 [endosymbiont of Galathealinum brachiosum]
MKHLKSKISRTLVLYIVLFSSVVTLCLTSIHLYVDYKDGIETLHQRIDQIKLTNIDSIKQSLWTMDYSSVEIQLNGLTRITDIIYVELTDENNKIIAKSGEVNTEDTIRETIDLKQKYRNKETEIGKIKIIATKENLYQHLINTVVIILITQAIKTFLVSIFILLIFYSLVTRHIEKITGHAEKIKLNSKVKPLSLDREKNILLKNDEIERLAESINFMSESIYNTYTDLFNSQHTLTEREAKFSAMFDSITDAIVFVDHERRIIQTNTAFTKYFDYSLDEIKGKTTQILYAVPEEYNIQGKKRYNINANSRPNVYEINYRRKDGSIFPGETMGGAVRLPDESLLGFIGIIRDISYKKETEEENTRLQHQLQQSQKMEAIGQLTGGIAHDFNNMLASILGYSELLSGYLEKSSDPKPLKYIKNITNAGERAHDLVEQLLTFSRSAPGNPQAINLTELIHKVTTLIRPTMPSSIHLEIEADENIPSVMMDNTQMHQILMNLCINARDAMHGKGNLSINLTSVNIEKQICSSCKEKIEGEYIKLSVSDTGTGIEKDLLENIFDPFKSTKPFGEGSGMGLSIVHGILHKHKSHIVVQTETGKGSIFSLFIPPYLKNETSTTINKPKTTPVIDNKKSHHILIVDDEEAVVYFMQDLLEKHNYKTTITTSSLKAVEIITNNPNDFDLIITDQTMPDMTGTEMIQKIFKITPDIPIILCSGYNKQVGEKEALELGCKKYLSKPIKNDYLIKSVQEIMGTD